MAIYSASLNYISLCPGGGGLDFGLELAIPHARPVCLVEREAFAVARLVAAMEEKSMAPAPVWSDVRTFDGRPWRGIVDGVIGGIPCQPHSVAGKRRGKDDDRDLWGDARRIIIQSGAWWCLIENVRGILTSGGAERVWNDLHRLGFDVEAGLFSAEEIGAPHRRERLFILAVANGAHLRFPLNLRERGDARTEFSASMRVCREVAYAISNGREPERHNHGCDDGSEFGATGQHTLVHAECSERRPQTGGRYERDRCDAGRHQTPGGLGEPSQQMGDSSCERGGTIPIQPGRQDPASTDIDRPSLFPPGPGAVDAWREILATSPYLEPAICRMDDGMASRVDELRMLGNGVQPLQGGYAIRTLVNRLARRNAGAAFLAGCMSGEVP